MNAKTAGRIPQVDRVLRHPLIVEEEKHVRREILAQITRAELAKLRQDGCKDAQAPDIDEIAKRVCKRSAELRQFGLRRIINGTGVILNTNLGRAPMPADVLDHISKVAGGYCNLEIDLETGKRGERGAHIEELLVVLTGCEAAIVVNNNAAAVLLAVNALSHNKEVVVSRGELIEIGGSFRLPEVVQSAEGVLKEIGTTNRTRLEDYRKAIGSHTGLLLRCHRSNFQITGFTEQATLEQLVQLSAETGIPLLEDLGSGFLIDLKNLGFGNEPTVQEVVKIGCGLICFSGDKLLGGPQAGIILGKRQLIGRLRAHPLYRALRADKMVLAGLEAVLSLYLSPQAEKLIPALSLASLTPEQLSIRAEQFCRRANDVLKNISCRTTSMESAAGGGALPGQVLKSHGLILESGLTPNKMASTLRAMDPPVIATIQENKIMLDLRTVSEADEGLLLDLLKQIDVTQFKSV